MIKSSTLAGITIGMFLLSTGHVWALDLSALGCPTKSTTTVSKIFISPSDSQSVRTALGVVYDQPQSCNFYIVEFPIPYNAGTGAVNISPARLFSFDSLANESISNSSDCQTYSQTTFVYRKPSGGKWGPAGYMVMNGTWINNKCHFAVKAGTDNVRNKTFHPPSSGTDLYRVGSRVVTGDANSPKARSVCIGLRFADIQNVAQPVCSVQ